MHVSPFFFAFMVNSTISEKQAIILTESIREFGGIYRQNPIGVLVPDSYVCTPSFASEISSFGAALHPFPTDGATNEFPFATKALAAAHAESLVEGDAAFLIWMDAGSLVLNEPVELTQLAGAAIGCSPVDHTLIGSPTTAPVSNFWKFIYRKCSVEMDKVFPVTTTIDNCEIRAYLNAGLLVVRPQRAVLRTWADTFVRIYQYPEAVEFYRTDPIYSVFIHQAVLAGVIVSRLPRWEIVLFSSRTNYPLHLRDECQGAWKPASLNDLSTCRYEGFFDEGDWEHRISIQEPLRSWLRHRFTAR